MKEIYIRAKAVNGTYVYAPIGTADTYGTILIDNESLKYYNDNNGKTKLRVDGAALVDENTLTHYTDNDGKTKLKVNSAKLIDEHNNTLYVVDNKLYVNVALVSRLANDEIWEKLNKKLDKTALVQNIGYDPSLIMSQRAVTEWLVKKLDKTEAKENFASLVNGKVPASQLPSYVDDVVEYDSKSDFPKPGETGKIYLDKSTNLTYRWSSNSNNYIMIGGGDLNLENSTGTGSLVQKTVSSSGTPYNNQASGSGAIAFGKNTKALGNADFVIGQNNTDNSSGSFVGGSNCTNTGNYAFVFGRYLNNTQIGAVRLGYYNKENDYTAFSIGIGDVDNRKNGLEYDAYTNTLSVPKGNILYGTNLQGNNAHLSGEVKIGKEFIGALGGKSVLRVGSYDKTPDVSGFEVDLVGNTTFLGKLKSVKTPVEDTDVVRKLELDEVAVKAAVSVLTQEQVDLLF